MTRACKKREDDADPRGGRSHLANVGRRMSGSRATFMAARFFARHDGRCRAPRGRSVVDPRSGTVRPKRRRRAWIAGAFLLAGAVIYFGFGWFVAYTEDAHIQSDLVAVAPEVAGVVQSVVVHDDQRVSAGDLIATIDPRSVVGGDHRVFARAAERRRDTFAEHRSRPRDDRRRPDRVVRCGVGCRPPGVSADLRRLRCLRDLRAGARRARLRHTARRRDGHPCHVRLARPAGDCSASGDVPGARNSRRRRRRLRRQLHPGGAGHHRPRGRSQARRLGLADRPRVARRRG